MIVGICKVELRIYEANSLKEKRHVIKSLIGKLSSRFNISIAEVDLNDLWQRAVIGFSLVSNETVQVNKVISNVLNFIENDGRVEIINNDIEIF